MTTTVIKCMDFRQNGFFKDWLKSINAERSDIISVAGSVKELAGENKERADWILGMIRISCEGHGSKRIIITNHSTCGAYKIDDLETEKKIQIEDLKRAEQIIKNSFPDMAVEKYWLELIGDHHDTKDIIFHPVD